MTVQAKDHHKFVNTHYMTRDAVVPFYISLILSADETETKRVNAIILSKWKPSGLLYIKERAWKAANALGYTFENGWL